MEDTESRQDAHETWVESLPAPLEKPLTEAEQERAAMLDRRSEYIYEGSEIKIPRVEI